MASTRLTNHSRDLIIKNVMAASFLQEQAKYDADHMAFSEQLYELMVPRGVEEAANKLPSGFILRTREMRVYLKVKEATSDGACYVNVKTAKERPYPYSCQYGNATHTSPTAAAAYEKLRQAERALTKARAELQDGVRQMVYAATTVEKLLAVWPEGKQFIPADLTPVVKPSVPAVMVETLNAMIKKAGVNPFPAEPLALAA